MDTPVLIGLIILCMISGACTIKLVEFFFSLEQKDERDEYIARTQKFISELQERLATVKTKTLEAQHKYIQCQSELTELQIKYDEKCADYDVLRKQHP